MLSDVYYTYGNIKRKNASGERTRNETLERVARGGRLENVENANTFSSSRVPQSCVPFPQAPDGLDPIVAIMRILSARTFPTRIISRFRTNGVIVSFSSGKNRKK